MRQAAAADTVQLFRSPEFANSVDLAGVLSLASHFLSSEEFQVGRAVFRIADASSIPMDEPADVIVAWLQNQNTRLWQYTQSLKQFLHQACHIPIEAAVPSFTPSLVPLVRQEEYLETLQWNVCHAGLRQIKLLLNHPDDVAALSDNFVAVEDPCGRLSFEPPSHYSSWVEGTSIQPTYAEIFSFGHRNVPSKALVGRKRMMMHSGMTHCSSF